MNSRCIGFADRSYVALLDLIAELSNANSADPFGNEYYTEEIAVYRLALATLVRQFGRCSGIMPGSILEKPAKKTGQNDQPLLPYTPVERLPHHGKR